MIAKKLGLSSLFLLLASATSTGLTSQAGIAASSSSYTRQPSCGCPHQPYWKADAQSNSYRPLMDCPHIFPKTVINEIYCPDFGKDPQTSMPLPQSPVRLAYDPDAREAKAQERANNVEAHVGRAVDTFADGVKKSLRENGSPTDALRDGGRAVVRQCAGGCHLSN